MFLPHQKNLQTLSDLEKLKEHYYQEYMEALRSKIDKQKQKIKRKEDILAKKINKREEKKVCSILRYTCFKVGTYKLLIDHPVRSPFPAYRKVMGKTPFRL